MILNQCLFLPRKVLSSGGLRGLFSHFNTPSVIGAEIGECQGMVDFTYFLLIPEYEIRCKGEEAVLRAIFILWPVGSALGLLLPK